MKPLITVIIPTIGRPDKARPGRMIASPYLLAAVASVLEQDYENIELLISDNNPASGTRMLLEPIRDERVRFVERPRRLISGAHFTACIQEAQGEFVTVLSDDDMLSSQYLSGLYEAFEQDPRVRVAVGHQTAIGENAEPYRLSNTPNRIAIYDGVGFMISRLWNPRRLPIMTYVSMLGRRTDILRIGGFPLYPDGNNADNFVMFALALSGKVAVSSRIMYYRVYETSFGLAAPFENLVLSCAQYEHDLRRFFERSHDRLSTPARLSLPILVRVRNVTMMTRRLLSHYRRRCGVREFAMNCAHLLAYAAAGHGLIGRPRVWLPS